MNCISFSPKTVDRSAYQGEYLLTAQQSVNTDSWQTGLNNNVLVLGCSGGGKTRHHLLPNLLQAQGSYIVLDGKGTLFNQVGPYLKRRGYRVDRLDFTTMDGTVGYDPLDHVRWSYGMPNQQDIIAIASAICPVQTFNSDPFWERAAANYLASYIAYVLETCEPPHCNFSTVISVFEAACEGQVGKMFDDLEHECPDSYAVSLYRRARCTCGAERMHSSIMGILAANLLPFGFPSVRGSFCRENRVEFSQYGKKKRALFVTMDDLDQSLSPLTSLFIQQAFTNLCDCADKNCAEGRLPVPVRFMLDDFANLNLPDFDNVLSVIRSREISCTVVCQTVSQLSARYGSDAANAIVGNCDTQLVMAFQDVETAQYFGVRANRTASALLETPQGQWWVFRRGEKGQLQAANRLEAHPAYAEYEEARAEGFASEPDSGAGSRSAADEGPSEDDDCFDEEECPWDEDDWWFEEEPLDDENCAA